MVNLKIAGVVGIGMFLSACGTPMDSTTDDGLGTDTSALRPRPPSAPGSVFTMSDNSDGNAVLAFERAPDGTLTAAGTFLTGGKGSGRGEPVLGSQGSVTLSEHGHFLFAVNAGSNDVSSFVVHGSELTLADRAPSGGLLPVSVTEHDGLVYVLNAGGDGNIYGLRVDPYGGLHGVSGSSRPLSHAQSSPAQVGFDEEGRTLVVTEKATQTLTLYHVHGNGQASAPIPVPSAGMTPFGFAFAGHNLLVSEAGPDAGTVPGAGTVSSYRLLHGTLHVVSPAVPDFQTAPCWLAATRNRKYAYVANAGSGNLSSFRVGHHGEIELIDPTAAVIPGGAPLDTDISKDDRYLYTLDTKQHAIQGYRVRSDATLDSLGSAAEGLPPSAVGLAVR